MFLSKASVLSKYISIPGRGNYLVLSVNNSRLRLLVYRLAYF